MCIISCAFPYSRYEFVGWYIYLEFFRRQFARRNSLLRMLLGLRCGVYVYETARYSSELRLKNAQHFLEVVAILRLWSIESERGSHLWDSFSKPLIHVIWLWLPRFLGCCWSPIGQHVVDFSTISDVAIETGRPERLDHSCVCTLINGAGYPLYLFNFSLVWVIICYSRK